MRVTGNYRGQAEPRGNKRRHFQYRAKIVTVDKPTVQLPCAISDISETGARIALEKGQELPEEFVLLLSERGAQRKCRIVWRTGAVMGVKFIERDL